METWERISCPECGEVMDRMRYKVSKHPSGVLIDVCKKHGVWLDRGELTSILAFIASAGNRPAFPTARNPVVTKEPGPITHDMGIIDRFYNAQYYPEESEGGIALLVLLLGIAFRLLGP